MKTLVTTVVILSVLTGFSLAIESHCHCEQKQILGEWRFSLSSGNNDKSITNKCPLNGTFPIEKEIVIHLEAPNIASLNGKKGTFTLIFDKAIEVTVDGKKYFAFFNYTNFMGMVTSNCDRTFTGVFHDVGVNPKNWGCFRGQMPNSSEENKRRAIQAPERTTFTNDVALVRKINEEQNDWTAASYPQLEGKLLDQSKVNLITSEIASHRRARAVQQVGSFETVSDLPDNFDWRNVSGVNYIPPAIEQGSCGSHYAISTLGMIESRIRIKTKNAKQPSFSVQQVLTCNHYSHSCDGGQPFTVAKFAEEFGLVDEDCAPYIGKHDKCPAACRDRTRHYATDYKYINGYYGAVNVKGMMSEIYKNGPIVAGFTVYREMYNYRSGIYKSNGWFQGNEPIDVNRPHTSTSVNHAILIVGWGTDSLGHKYWIVRNSWGRSWGMDGFFYIIRGHNDCSIESLAVSAIPVL